MAWAPQVWEKLAISNYLRQVNSQQKSTKQKCDSYIKHLSGGTSKCRNARDSAKVALSWLGATWFWSDFFLTGFWPDSIYLIFDHIVCVWFCIYGMYIYTYIYIYMCERTWHCRLYLRRSVLPCVQCVQCVECETTQTTMAKTMATSSQHGRCFSRSMERNVHYK